MTVQHRTILLAALAAATACTNGHGLDSTRPDSHCGTDVHVCKDGSAVGRIGRECDWQACPRSAVPATDESTGDGQTAPVAPTPPDGNQPPFAMPH